MNDITNIISFPGLGINELKIKEIAFNIFGRGIAWYGLIIVIGILSAFFYVLYRAKKTDISTDDILDLAIVTIISAIIGARLYYVLTSLSDYKTFYDVIAIWEGGLAIYGAIIGGGIAAYIVCKIKKIKPLQLFDFLAPAVMLGQIIGRWGNFCNAEAYGDVSEYVFFTKTFLTPNAKNLPWIMKISENVNGVTGTSFLAHPTFLYESLWNLLGFVILNIFYKRKKYHGQIFFGYLAWYGFGRMFIEGFRTDSLYVGNIKISQLVGLLCFLFGIAVLIIKAITGKENKAVTESASDSKDSVSLRETKEETPENDNTEEITEDTENKQNETDEISKIKEEKIKEEKEETDGEDN